MGCPARPLLSVVTVVRDDAAGFAATRDSLSIQSFRDFEWLVAEGGSVDGTAAAVLHAVGDGEIGWARLGPDTGPFDGMRLALAQARGTFTLFLNAGDRLAGPDSLTRVVPHLDDPNLDLLCAAAGEFDTCGRLRVKRPRSPGAIAYGMPTHHCAIIYRTDAARRVGLPNGYAVAADYALTAGLIAAGASVRLDDAPLAVFGPPGLSRRLAVQGRWEQDDIRRTVLGMGPIGRRLILGTQNLAARLSRDWPAIHGILRYR